MQYILSIGLLSTLILISGALYVVWAQPGRNLKANLARFATVALTLGLALLGVISDNLGPFQVGVVAGLALSLLGDFFFILPRERFVAGLVAYLLGHLGYICAFAWSHGNFLALNWWPVVIGPLTFYLYKRVSAGMKEKGQGELAGPAGVYSIVLATMLWQAVSTLSVPGLPFRAWLVALGACFFFFADALLVWHRFIRPIPNQPLTEMGSYFAAQYCFALAVVWAG